MSREVDKALVLSLGPTKGVQGWGLGLELVVLFVAMNGHAIDFVGAIHAAWASARISIPVTNAFSWDAFVADGDIARIMTQSTTKIV